MKDAQIRRQWWITPVMVSASSRQKISRACKSAMRYVLIIVHPLLVRGAGTRMSRKIRAATFSASNSASASLRPAGAHLHDGRGRCDEGFQGRGKGFGIARRHKASVESFAHHFPAARHVGDHCCAAHAHAFHDRGGRTLPPGRQNQNMRGGHKGPHVPRVAQIFDAALVFPGFDLRRTHAAQALLRRPQHLKTGFRMTGFEQACGSGVFRQTFGFQEAAYQQKDRRPGGGQRGKGAFRRSD